MISLKKIWGLFFLLCFSFFVFPQAENDYPVDYPSFYPFISSEYTDSLPQQLSAEDIFELSLLLSECPLDSSEGQECIKLFEKIKAEVTSEEYQNMSAEEKGKAVLKLLYRDYLTTYSYNQTRLNTALQQGTYNCVSSAILYMAAAKAAGLEVRGQKTNEHAFCTVYIEGKKIDVETTNPYGFNPGSKEALDNQAFIKKYYVVPKKNYANRHETSDKAFCGLISANLAAYDSYGNNFSISIPNEANRYELIKDENSKDSQEARSDLDALAGNFINQKITSSDELFQKLNWLNDYIEHWGMSTSIQKVLDVSVYNFFATCYNEHELNNSLQNYSKFNSIISASQKKSILEMLYSLELKDLTDSLFPNQKKDFLYSLLTETKNNNQNSLIPEDFIPIPEKNIETELANTWAEILNSFMKSKAFEDGYHQAEIALSQLPLNSSIKQIRNTFYNNVIATIHNDFAIAFNKQHYLEALFIIEEGLERFPEDKKLLDDHKTVEEMLQSRFH